MIVYATQGDNKVKLVNTIDYIIENTIFKIINNKYMPIKNGGIMENIWTFQIQYDYEIHKNRKQRRSENKIK